jgi:hypothetical protein
LVRGKRTADPSASLGMTKRGGQLRGKEWLLKERVLVRGRAVARAGFGEGERELQIRSATLGMTTRRGLL